jgi:hypothetical protein
MCVWIEGRRLKEYFSSVIISLTFQNYERSELKLKASGRLFFKFKVENKREERIFLQLTNVKNGRVYRVEGMQAVRNEGKELVGLREGEGRTYGLDLAELECEPGEYMCYYQTGEPEG